jgi:hypothetical protein
MWVCIEIYIHIHIYRLSIIDCYVRLQGTSNIRRSVSPLCVIKMNNLKQNVILIDKFQGSPKPLLFFTWQMCLYCYYFYEFYRTVRGSAGNPINLMLAYLFFVLWNGLKINVYGGFFCRIPKNNTFITNVPQTLLHLIKFSFTVANCFSFNMVTSTEFSSRTVESLGIKVPIGDLEDNFV